VRDLSTPPPDRARSAPQTSRPVGLGGFKVSGLGREYGFAGLNTYLEYKTVTMLGRPSSI